MPRRGIASASLSGDYLKLDCSNDPLTGDLSTDENILIPASKSLVVGSTDNTYATNPLTLISQSEQNTLLVNTITDTSTGGINLMRKARGSLGAETIVQDDDNLGGFFAQGYDGSTYRNAASFSFWIDGTPGSGDMPGRVEIATAPDGSYTTEERIIIYNDGSMCFGNKPGAEQNDYFHFRTTGSSGSEGIVLQNNDNTIGSAASIRFKAYSGLGSYWAKGMLQYESTLSSGRGDFVFYQDVNTDVGWVTSSNRECLRIKNDGSVVAGYSFSANGYTENIVEVSATYTATANDDVIICDGTFPVTLPALSGITGKIYTIKNVGTGVITVDGDGAETIDGFTTQVISNQYDAIKIIAGASEWHIL